MKKFYSIILVLWVVLYIIVVCIGNHPEAEILCVIWLVGSMLGRTICVEAEEIKDKIDLDRRRNSHV